MMKYAIIAAGKGTRLASAVPKPLAEVGGKALLRRLLDAMEGDVRIIVSDDALAAWLAREAPEVLVIQHSTASPAESLRLLLDGFEGDKIIATTADTLFNPDEFKAFAEAFEASDADALMGVTEYVDDEKPLYVVTEGSQITAFSDTPAKYASAGIYGLGRKALDLLKADRSTRLRDYQRNLLTEGLRVEAYPFSTVFDIDRPEDLEKAEKSLNLLNL